MKIALAQIPHPESFEKGLETVLHTVAHAGELGARLVCFPECCVKGLRGVGFPIAALTRDQHNIAVDAVARQAKKTQVHVILPIERPWRTGWQNGSYVLSADGATLGYQSKNQLTPEEELWFQPGSTRRIFTVDGMSFGICLSQEAWYYPETVRWSARRGASIVFHPHFAGGPGKTTNKDKKPYWGTSILERLAQSRAVENSIFMASVNYALGIQDTMTTIVTPEGECLDFAAIRQVSTLVHDVDLKQASLMYAHRLALDRYQEE